MPEAEQAISKNDMQILDKFKAESNKPARVSEGKSLADLIMQKLNAGDFQDGKEFDEMGGSEERRQGTNFGVEEMDQKVIATYKKLGVVMKTYRSGKLPKAFKVIPMVKNWEELLFLTQPH